MNPRLHLLPTIVGAALITAVPSSFAILGFKNDNTNSAPTAAELSDQESKAMELYAEAGSLQKNGKTGKARGIYESIVKSFPLTKTAAQSQFRIGNLLEGEKDVEQAFGAYQTLLTKYGGSDLFAETIKRQFELANKAMNTKTSKMLGLIPTKAARSSVIEMFSQIASNAPQSKYAPMALYQVAILFQENGQDAESIVAFQEMVDSYPRDPLAKEAKLQIIDIRGNRWTRDDRQDQEAIVGMLDFINRNEEDPRSEGLRARVGSLEEKENEKKFNIGRYYERKGNLRSAAMYYQSVKASNSDISKAALARLEELKGQDPNLLQSPTAPKHKVVAPVNTVDREDYYGPAPPKLEAAPKPKMRVSPVEIQPIPAGS